mgnify:CR=1 FL=1
MNYLSTHSPFTPAEKAAKQSLFKDFGCLFFRFISGNNSIYFSNSQIIRSILFLIRSVMFCMEISCLFDDHSVQCKKCNQVRECHQCIEDIRDIPYCFYGPMNTARIYRIRYPITTALFLLNRYSTHLSP